MGITKTKRAGLVFNVGRFHRLCKTKHMRKKRISASMPVYLAGVVEYLAAEVLELAGSVAREMKSKRISPRHVYLAVMNDEDLAKLFENVTIPGAGVVPQIRPELLGVGGAQASGSNSSPAAKAKAGVSPKVSKAVGRARPAAAPAAKPAAAAAAKPTVTKTVSNLAGQSTILSERVFPGNQKLSVLQGNIVAVKCDAVVHPCGGSVSFGGEVGGHMRRKGGQQLETDTVKELKNKSLATSEAVAGPATGLLADYVIHVSSPHWNANNTSCIQDLERAVQNIMKAAEQKGCKDLALPSISSGGAGFPKQTAAETILRTIKLYMDAHPNGTVKHVYFVLFDKESVNVYVNELGRLDIAMTKK